MQRDWIEFDHEKPTAEGVYEWKHTHPLGFEQRFFAEMRMRGAGHQNILSPAFDHWDGYKVHVPKGFSWRVPVDLDAAKIAEKKSYVTLDLDLRDCPFCGKPPVISASQCGYPGGGNGVVIWAKPYNYNTWHVEQCCRMIGINGFKSPFALASAWNAAPAAKVDK